MSSTNLQAAVLPRAIDRAQAEREFLDWMYPDRHERRPMRYNHLPAQERNAEIIRRRQSGGACPPYHKRLASQFSACGTSCCVDD
jgi:hypothetical protein